MGINSEYGASEADFEAERRNPPEPAPWWVWGIFLPGVIILGIAGTVLGW